MSADDRLPLLLLRFVEYTCDMMASLLNGETTPWLLGTNDGAKKLIARTQRRKGKKKVRLFALCVITDSFGRCNYGALPNSAVQLLNGTLAQVQLVTKSRNLDRSETRKNCNGIYNLPISLKGSFYIP